MTDGEVWSNHYATENQRKNYEKIFRRIGKFKKYMYDMCNLISNHAVKLAGLRDKNDEIAQCLDEFTKIEEFSTTSKLSMAVAAELVATVGDHQDLAVKRVETLVLPNLLSYARICDCLKADVWNAIQAIGREKKKKKIVKQLKKKTYNADPKNKARYDTAQRELERASAETARLCQLSEEQVLKFEHKRLMDLKESLSMFVKIQIANCAKSLELLSETYKQINNIDEDGDLDILKHSLQICDKSSSKSKSTSKGKLKKAVQNSSEEQSKETSKKTSIILNSSKNSIKKQGSGQDENSSQDSSHSEDVRRLEKVLKKRPKERTKSQRDTQPGPESAKHRKCKSEAKQSTRHKVNLGNTTGKEDAKPTVDQANSHETERKCRTGSFYDDDDSPIPVKVLGKRPSTPTRPVTVPRSGHSSTEDISSRQEDLAPSRRKSPRCQQPHPTQPTMINADNSYYYSQSEDEKKTSRPAVVKGVRTPSPRDQLVKRVSFLNQAEIRRVPASNFSPANRDSSMANFTRSTGAGDNQTRRNAWAKPVDSNNRSYC